MYMVRGGEKREERLHGVGQSRGLERLMKTINDNDAFRLSITCNIFFLRFHSRPRFSSALLNDNFFFH